MGSIYTYNNFFNHLSTRKYDNMINGFNRLSFEDQKFSGLIKRDDMLQVPSRFRRGGVQREISNCPRCYQEFLRKEGKNCNDCKRRGRKRKHHSSSGSSSSSSSSSKSSSSSLNTYLKKKSKSKKKNKKNK